MHGWLLYARGYVGTALRLQTECEFVLTAAHMFKPTKRLSSTGAAGDMHVLDAYQAKTSVADIVILALHITKRRAQN